MYFHGCNFQVPPPRLGLIHTGRARKFERKPFDVAYVQCEHSHSRTQVPFALRHVARPVWMRRLTRTFLTKISASKVYPSSTQSA